MKLIMEKKRKKKRKEKIMPAHCTLVPHFLISNKNENKKTKRSLLPDITS
jgi:hypothetical protein